MSRYVTTRPCRFVLPRQAMDPSERMMRHGKVQPMEQPSRGLFGWMRK